MTEIDVISVDDVRLRIVCWRCKSAVIFTSGGPAIAAYVCHDCGEAQTDAHHVVNSFKQFVADVRRFKNVNAMFEVEHD